ncbi:Phytoene dehydrogenase-related protein [Filimonas lacunae]|uniref:Phytoene dehydrogenase-related protein n=1 Tax=Filimonas lacunae TaxID=477680 RepID=A0A173MIK7_9BACT|nr:NAD(P)/FAD-dependent oxidoreductase [Filimonas lacunae]BAV07251.1 phytoene dehydrogenase and related proteins [Filimonas lacunae]SIS92561.1 Phytoene dehydrogenase-related protein [Filimonas lacunae]
MKTREKRDVDVVVVGAGPNGLAAAITLQQAGLQVLLIEGKDTIGGGMRSASFTLPGFVHDVCSAVHPLAAASPFFQTLPLTSFGLEWLYPEIAAAHPFDNGMAAALYASVGETAAQAGKDTDAYNKLMQPLANKWDKLLPALLGPFDLSHAFTLSGFGLSALQSAYGLASRHFQTPVMRGLMAGMAAHCIQPLTNKATAAVALVLLLSGHGKGWPIPKGGSQQLANALAGYFQSLGGTIETGLMVQSLSQLPSSHAVLLDVTPQQLLRIAGHQLSPLYRWQLERYRYGMGVFKMDWAIEGAVPFVAEACRKAGTVHIGNTMEEITAAELQTWKGRHVDVPFVLLAQPGVCDASRAPEGRQSVWGYCHVPAGSARDMTEAVERQVERFAPGFRDQILDRHVMSALDMEQYNPNYIGGDIGGGVQDIGQLFTRPALRLSPYRTSAKGIYICSSSTPPGGGVHGMCGYYAAQRALKDVFL